MIEITSIDENLTDEALTELTKKVLKNININLTKKNEGKYYSVLWFLAELVRNVTNHANIESI